MIEPQVTRNEELEPTFSYPGIGGSLGKCALCGTSFTFQILTGEHIATVTCSWFPDKRLPMHKECADEIANVHNALELRPGPLRTAFEQSQVQP
jgi:hypothetical protein